MARRTVDVDDRLNDKFNEWLKSQETSMTFSQWVRIKMQDEVSNG